MAHPGLRREVDDAGKILVGRDQGEHRLVIGYVELGKNKAGFAAQLGEPSLLQTRVVIVVDAVDADDAFAAVEQRAGGMEADEPGDPGDENRHKAPGINERLPYRLVATGARDNFAPSVPSALSVGPNLRAETAAGAAAPPATTSARSGWQNFASSGCGRP